MPQSAVEWEEKYKALKRRYDSLAKSLTGMEKAIETGGRENVILQAQADNADQNVRQQKTIVRNHLSQTAEKETELTEEIRALRKTLKEHGIKVE